MADLDAELLERVARWCAEAGRQAGVAEIRRALGALGWDELLAVRALIADPPPARPLGPKALADIARGAPPDVAAERERAGRYDSEQEERGDSPEAGPASPIEPPRPRRRSGAKKAPAVVIRRARDRAQVAGEAAPPALSRLEDLRRPEGRGVLERLLRRHGARRAALAQALAARWRRDDGAPPGEGDLAALFEHHGLARAFARRERDELLHALRASGGYRPAAAERLALDPAGLDAALARLGAGADAERIRDERRAELRGRATLTERVHLVLADEARLRDLGLLGELEEDLRARLPEHVRALRAGGAPLAEALAQSLSIERRAALGLASRFGLDLGPSPDAPRRSAAASPRRGGAGARRPQVAGRSAGRGGAGGRRGDVAGRGGARGGAGGRRDDVAGRGGAGGGPGRKRPDGGSRRGR